MKGIKFRKNNEQYYPDTRYEIGDLYLTTRPENPSDRFGGTWELFGPGRTLVCINTSDTDFNTVKKIGGSKYLQSHNHDITNLDVMVWANTWGISGNQASTPGTSMIGTIGAKNLGKYAYTASSGTGNSGNLQPFITCYIWIRTA